MTEDIKELKRKAILYGLYDEADDTTFTDEGIMLSVDGDVLIPDEIVAPDPFSMEAFQDMMTVRSRLADLAWGRIERSDDKGST